MRAVLAIIAVIIAYIVYKAFQVQLKSGVDLTSVNWRMFWAAIVADGIFLKHGTQATITSGVDGEHSENSLHYRGLALDFRTRDLPKDEVSTVAEELQAALGKDYAVLIESDHIHTQYTWENVKGGSPYV